MGLSGDVRLATENDTTPVWDLAEPAGYVAPTPPDPAETLVSRFHTVVEAYGDRVALSGPSGTYEYAELDRVTTAMAARLSSSVSRHGRIALLCTHDTGAVIGILSALKAGCAYVPLDPRQPDSRLKSILRDAKVAVIACDAELANRARSIGRELPVLSLELPSDSVPTDRQVLPDPEADDLAYLIYTSGSTGRPKAVVQSHRNVLAHACLYATRMRVGPTDRLSLLSRFTFDAAVMDIFGALVSGASIHVIDPYAPAATLRTSISESETSVLHCTPTIFRYLLDDRSGQDGERQDSFAAIRTVVLGGEEVTQRDAEQFFRDFPEGCSLVNGLGPTECTLLLQHLVNRSDLRRPAVPVGHPVDGIRVRLRDEKGDLSEEFGELEVLGERVALKYWSNPEATLSAFGRDPDGTRFYRTGDLLRRLPDGALVYCGRKDRQVKIRGHRVEPGEAEALLRSHPSVAQSVVTVDRDEDAGPRLVGYVTSAAATMPADAAELSEYLQRQLPSYALPWRLMVLESLPIGPTGKVDLRSLPRPRLAGDAPVDDAPRTELERAVVSLWCDVLGVTSIGMRADFVSCGGDSIQLMRLMFGVSEQFGADVSMPKFLQAPTPATLTELIMQEGGVKTGRDDDDIG